MKNAMMIERNADDSDGTDADGEKGTQLCIIEVVADILLTKRKDVHGKVDAA